MSFALLVSSHESFGEALAFANKALESQAVELLEAVPMGSKGQVILKGNPADLEKFSSETKTFSLITKQTENVLKNYYNLEFSDVQSELCVIESEQPEDLLFAMAELLELNWKCVDLRIPRSGKSCGYLLMTGEKALANSNFGKPSLKIKSVSKINKRFKDYYNLGVKD